MTAYAASPLPSSDLAWHQSVEVGILFWAWTLLESLASLRSVGLLLTRLCALTDSSKIGHSLILISRCLVWTKSAPSRNSTGILKPGFRCERSPVSFKPNIFSVGRYMSLAASATKPNSRMREEQVICKQATLRIRPLASHYLPI